MKIIVLFLIVLAIVFGFTSNKKKEAENTAEKETYESILNVIANEELPRRYNEPYFFKDLFTNEEYSTSLAYELALKIAENNLSKAIRNLEYINNSLDVKTEDYVNLNTDAGFEYSLMKELEFKYAYAQELIENDRQYEAYNLLRTEILSNYEDSSELAKQLKAENNY